MELTKITAELLSLLTKIVITNHPEYNRLSVDQEIWEQMKEGRNSEEILKSFFTKIK